MSRFLMSLSSRLFGMALCASLCLMGSAASAQETGTAPTVVPLTDPFQQIDQLLPTPSESRLASGAPGPKYWQQKVDYTISATLDEAQKQLRGEARIVYHNNSPHELPFLWLQLDINQFSPESDATRARLYTPDASMTVNELQQWLERETFDGRMVIEKLTDGSGTPLKNVTNKGLMRVDLERPLPSGASTTLEIAWHYPISNVKFHPARTGYELLEDDTPIFGLAYWFPRLCAYTDYGGWRLKQFIRYGEFTVEFGDYDVRITTPADHIVTASGDLQNPQDVFTQTELARWEEADRSATPVMVVTKEEADERRQSPVTDGQTKTWHFRSENIRDFAFSSSRAFLADALGCPLPNGHVVRCASLYPREGLPLWNKYASHAVAQAIETYSEVTGIPYPWPHATAILGTWPGMEFPMISYNRFMAEKDGTYSETLKKRLVSVIIHETGHNWFPMIINNDERHWMWLDEGFNRFVQVFAERSWNRKMYEDRNLPHRITNYLTSSQHQPIMMQPDHLLVVGRNAYDKTGAGLMMLRESILGRQLFDTAFQNYCRTWAYKRPEPSDFFRSIENSAGQDLDWFWRGWFFTNNYSDLEIASVRKLQPVAKGSSTSSTSNPSKAYAPPDLALERDADQPQRFEVHQELLDFYDNDYPEIAEREKKEAEERLLKRLKPDEAEALKSGKLLYEVTIKNHGGMPMPLKFCLEYDDDSKEFRTFPAEVWRQNTGEIALLLITAQPLKALIADPYNETGDVDFSNNRFPRRIEEAELPITIPSNKIDNPLQREIARQKKAADKSESAAGGQE